MIIRNLSFLLCYCLSLICIGQESYIEDNWKSLANSMVNYQIIDRGIKDKDVIRVMKNTPRHLFVLKEFIFESYNDYPLPIEEDQTISQPYIVALMTELLDLNRSDRVLEIGTGSGYQLAIISQLVDSCYSIEIKKSLAEKSKKTLNLAGYDNVKIKHGDGYKGWIKYAPFDKIIITAAPKEIPDELINQLKDGGLMVLPVGESNNQELIVLKKNSKTLEKKYIIPVRFVPMIHGEE